MVMALPATPRDRENGAGRHRQYRQIAAAFCWPPSRLRAVAELEELPTV